MTSYPQSTHSWTLLSDKIAVKQLDKSSFLHHGTGIPREFVLHFTAGAPVASDDTPITLVYKDTRYPARLRVSVWTVGRYLKRWGLTPQKPMRRAFEQDPEAVRHWLQEEYPKIATAAKRENAQIHWGDEMGLRSDHQTGTTYGRRGQTPVILGTGQRFRCNMISTITNRGKLAFMVFQERFTARVFVEFLRRLVRHASQKVFLIVDGHPVHRSGLVKRWLCDHANMIQMIRLPPYSPELNPDELLNQDVKSNALGRQRPLNLPDLMKMVWTYLWSTQRRTDIVCSYFREAHVCYAS